MTRGFNPRLEREIERSINGAAISFDPAERLAYGYDNSRRQAMPDAIAWADSHDQVQAIVRFCYQHAIPLIARGLGSNTVGATVPVEGGVVLSLERMQEIRAIETADRYCVVEPGLTNANLQQALGQRGFLWPPDPTSAPYSTVGGNLACNAAGPRAVKYGTARENTLGLRVVTGRGETLKTGVYTTKGVVGYDLTRLIIGSEGTLGVITEATLKLTATPESKRTVRAAYRDPVSAARAVAAIMAQAEIPSALEFMDEGAVALVRDHSDVDLPSGVKALLLIEVDGFANELDHAVARIEVCAKVSEPLDVQTAQDAAAITNLWAARKALSPALRRAAAGKINEDVAVPVSRLPELLQGIEKLSTAHGIRIISFGHAGNGNLHVNLLYEPGDEIQTQAVERCLKDLFDLVLALNGTLSGEHGVGIAKQAFIESEVGTAALQVMQEIKSYFDPKGILNPGKIFPPSV